MVLREQVENRTPAESITFAKDWYCETYTQLHLKRLVNFHKDFANRFKVENPYFSYTGNTEPYFLQNFQDGTTLHIGPISSLSDEMMAAFLETQMYLYVAKGTMGPNFPLDSNPAETFLRKSMMADFGPNRVVTLLYKKDGESITLLSGVQSYWGNSEQTLSESIKGGDDTKTSLSSLWASEVETQAPEVTDFLEKHGDVPEDKVVLMSRLFNQNPEVHTVHGSKHSDAAWLAMASLSFGIKKHAEVAKLDYPSIVMYDTHNSKIQKYLEALFLMKVWASQGSVTPSQEVLETILHWHYGEQGFAGQIMLGYQDFSTYATLGGQVLQRKLVEENLLVEGQGLENDVEDQTLLPIFARPFIDALAQPKVLSPEDVTPKITPTTSLLHLERDKLKRRLKDRKIGQESYLSHVKEIVELRTFLENIGIREVLTGSGSRVSITQLRKEIVTRFYRLTDGITKKDIEVLTKHGDFVADLVSFYNDILEVTGGVEATTQKEWKQALLNQSVVVSNPDEETASLQVSHQAFRLLFNSRLLGLIPRKVLDRLQEMQIRVVGASAAMPAVRLLMLLGAENMVFVDDGIVDGNKNQMMQAGGYKMNGQFKSVALLKQLFAYNPFANFTGIIGRSVKDEADKRDLTGDITFKDLLEFNGKHPDLVVEVVDDAKTKTNLRTWLEENRDEYPEIMLGWLADTHSPFAGLEKIGDGKQFNHDFDAEALKRFSKISSPVETLRMFWKILQTSFPTEHKHMFLSVMAKLVPFLSQTPLAAQESSSTLVRLVLRKITEEIHTMPAEVEGKNVTAKGAPQRFMPDYTPAQVGVLEKIAGQMLDL